MVKNQETIIIEPAIKQLKSLADKLNKKSFKNKELP